MQFQDLKALNLKLPEIKTAGSNLALDDLVLSIRKNGDFLLNGNAISETALIEILSASVKYSQSPTLLISADEEAPLKFVTKAIDICRTNGVGDFRLHSVTKISQTRGRTDYASSPTQLYLLGHALQRIVSSGRVMIFSRFVRNASLYEIIPPPIEPAKTASPTIAIGWLSPSIKYVIPPTECPNV